MFKWKVFFLAMVGSMMLFSAPALAASTCYDWTAACDLDLVDPANLFSPVEGTVIGYLNGEQMTIALTSEVKEMKYTEDGTILILIHYHWTLADGSTLTLVGHPVLSPTEVPYLSRINARIDPLPESGTGIFQNAFGHIVAHGEFNFATFHITGEQAGKLCW
jgi:hypothetical protein